VALETRPYKTRVCCTARAAMIQYAGGVFKMGGANRHGTSMWHMWKRTAGRQADKPLSQGIFSEMASEYTPRKSLCQR